MSALLTRVCAVCTAPLLESIDDNPYAEFVNKFMGRFTEMREQMKGLKDRHKRLQFLHQNIAAGSRVRANHVVCWRRRDVGWLTSGCSGSCV